MTRLITDPDFFSENAIAGFVSANSRYVRQIKGGVVRSKLIPQGHVGIVTGGGSGHYPAFAGFVGPGLAAGAACGNIFASPSSGQVYRVGKSVERGAGLVLAIGNYAGDVFQFGLAAERLRLEGVDVRQNRAVVILNGLGAFKYEELFVLFGAVTERLRLSGVEIADTECGEFVTSLDMAGVSLTLFWVDEELEALWKAPADSPAYRRGTVQTIAETELEASYTQRVSVTAALFSEEAVTEADAAAAAVILKYLKRVQAALLHSEEELGRLDVVAGDGDHGIGMSRGAAGAIAAAEKVVAERGSVKRLLLEAGEGWSEAGGGTSGALWGIALTAAGASLGTKGSHLDSKAISQAVDAALIAVQNLGKAKVGDKTLIDAFVPFADELRRLIDEGCDLARAWQAAARCSAEAADKTAHLLPRIGRARPHGEKSLGHPDAGAVSFARIVSSIVFA